MWYCYQSNILDETENISKWKKSHLLLASKQFKVQMGKFDLTKR